MRFFKLLTSYLPDRAILQNAGWLLGDHLITFAGGLLISVWLARYLGPAAYGVFGFAMSIYAIASSFAHLGMNGVSVRELVQSSDVSRTLSTIAGMKVVGVVLSVLSVLFYLSVANVSGDKAVMTAIICSALLLNPLTVIDSYFDSITQSKWRVIARRTGFVVKSTLVVAFILFNWNFMWLAAIIVSEHLVAALIAIRTYYRKGPSFLWTFDPKIAKHLWRQSWPLVISGLGAILYLKMDQVMVVSMIDDTAGGQYNAAVKYTTIFYFLHTVVLTSIFPRLVATSSNNKALEMQFKKVAGVLLYSSFAIIVVTYLLIEPMILWSFGDKYLEAVDIIKYHIFSLPLVFLGAVLSKWLIIKELTKFSMVRHGMGFAVNLALNLFLIPKIGGKGAALASIGALFFSSFVILFFHESLRQLMKIIAASFLWPFSKLKTS